MGTLDKIYLASIIVYSAYHSPLLKIPMIGILSDGEWCSSTTVSTEDALLDEKTSRTNSVMVNCF